MAIWNEPEEPLCLNFHIQIVPAQNDQKPTKYWFLKKSQPNRTKAVFLEKWAYETKYLSEGHMIKMKFVFWSFRKLLSQVTNKFGKAEAQNRVHKLELREMVKIHFSIDMLPIKAFMLLSSVNLEKSAFQIVKFR